MKEREKKRGVRNSRRCGGEEGEEEDEEEGEEEGGEEPEEAERQPLKRQRLSEVRGEVEERRGKR